MIHDTTYNLELLLQRIEEKMTKLTAERDFASAGAIDLKDEKEVTRQCLRICKEARSYLDVVSTGASSLLQEASQNGSEDRLYDAQRRTREMLNETRDSLTRTSSHLARRLECLSLDYASTSDHERRNLKTDIEMSKRCLEVCNMASEISRQKVYKVGEAIADGDSDQVLVTTMADLFDVGKAVPKDNSAQLLGFMSPDDLRHVVDKRYGSRFGAIHHATLPDRLGTLLCSIRMSLLFFPFHEAEYCGPSNGSSPALKRHATLSPNRLRL
ncbi:hypothetical protein LTR62_001936 [Meristemomyces frigidus]|uniref:Azaphilone pigments biosynthesis cluster protein L N-terminal domain-containing protein n=1 Tax=Meristemomyces frigidus TaxID=1508187 RepID=A0AAN7T8U4_9PEZI|nr:hypothetical protein LTR62_001936 [Meristemomyces frigidus]